MMKKTDTAVAVAGFRVVVSVSNVSVSRRSRGVFFERLGLVSVSASYVSFTTLRGRAFDVF